MAAYDSIDQNIVSSCLVQGHTDDSFYNPVSNSHTGYASDGNYYSLGSTVPAHRKASWFTEYTGTATEFRGNQAAFPSYGLILLSPVALTIFNQAIPVVQAASLPMWMTFVLGDNNALANNYNFSLQGFLPKSVCYADGIVSVTYSPDAGNFHLDAVTPPAVIYVSSNPSMNPLLEVPGGYPSVPTTSSMVVSIDFSLDSVYLDVAVGNP